MKKIVLTSLLSVFCVISFSQNTATLDNGKKIIVYENGTWKYADSVKTETKPTISVQCKGTTTKGEQCKNNTKNENGYCGVHQSQAEGSVAPATETKSSPSNSGTVQCSATTKAGSRCKRMTSSSNGLCWQHGGN